MPNENNFQIVKSLILNTDEIYLQGQQLPCNPEEDVIVITDCSTNSGGSVTIPPHNELNGLQGGTITERYHLSRDQYLSVVNPDLTHVSLIAGPHITIGGSYPTFTINGEAGFSGNYNDLTNKPNIVDAYTKTQSDAKYKNINYTPSWTEITGKPVFFNGSYNSLTDKPSYAIVATSGSYNDLLNKPTIPPAYNLIAGNNITLSGTYPNQTISTPNNFSGNYNDLSNRPTLFSGSYTDLTNKPTLFNGDYNSLINKPIIFDGTWNSLSGKPSFSPVATSGSYNDLINKPDGSTYIQNVNSTPTTAQTSASIYIDGKIKASKLFLGIIGTSLTLAGDIRTNSSLVDDVTDVFGIVTNKKVAFTAPFTFGASPTGVVSTVRVGSSNTQNWPIGGNSHPSIQSVSALLISDTGSTGEIAKGAVYFGTAAGNGASFNEFNLIDLTYDHSLIVKNASGIRITDLDLGTLGNTFIFLNNGDSAHLPNGNWGIYSDTNYNHYLGTGNTLIGSTTDNGAKLQVTGKATVSIAPTNPTDVVRLMDLPASSIIDSIPTNGSSNAVSSNGVFNALLTKVNTSDLSSYELLVNKQNSLSTDSTNIKYPTVTAVNTGLATKGTLTATNFWLGANIYSGASAYVQTRSVDGNTFTTLDGNGASVGFNNSTIANTIAIRSSYISFSSGLISGNNFSGQLNNVSGLTGNRTWSWPDKSGTIAMISDITNITIDSTPTSASTNAVQSGGTFTALATKAGITSDNIFTGANRFKNDAGLLFSATSSNASVVKIDVTSGIGSLFLYDTTRTTSAKFTIGNVQTASTNIILTTPSLGGTLARIEDIPASAPVSGSTNYIQNQTASPQTSTSFNIDGGGTFGNSSSIYRPTNDALPTLVLDGNQTLAGKVLSIKQLGIETGIIDNNGRLFGAGIANYTLLSNASVNTTVNGTIITQNLPSASNGVLVVRQLDTTATNNLVDFQLGSASKFKINTVGIIGINGVSLTSLQSFRTNAAGTASEAFIAANASDLVNYMNLTSNQIVSGNKTFSNTIFASNGVASKNDIYYTDASGFLLSTLSTNTTSTITKGILSLFSNNTTGPTRFSNTLYPANVTANRSATLQDKDGTIAYLSDLPQTVEVSTTSQAMSGNTTYVLHNTALTTVTLPTTNPTIGTLITILGEGSGGFKVAQNSGQFIMSGNSSTTVGTGGSIQSTANNTTVTLRYVNTNKWMVSSSNSSFVIT